MRRILIFLSFLNKIRRNFQQIFLWKIATDSSEPLVKSNRKMKNLPFNQPIPRGESLSETLDF